MLLPGSPPTVNDPSDDVVSFFADNRGQVLVGTLLIGLGVLSMVWFVASLVEAMRRADEERLATAALIGFVLTFAVGTVSALTRASLAYSVAGILQPDEARALFHVSLVMDAMSSLMFAAFAIAVGAASLRSGVLPRWWGWGQRPDGGAVDPRRHGLVSRGLLVADRRAHLDPQHRVRRLHRRHERAPFP